MADIKDNFENALDKDEKAQKGFENSVVGAKQNLPNVIPPPPDLHAQASAFELKSRLNGGEPALTILDIRPREAFNAKHILGAQAMPMDSLVDRAQSSLEPERDIYVYGANDGETAEAATALRSAGFLRVSELKGGVDMFEEIGGSIEGTATDEEPTAGAYNVVARLQEFKEEQEKGRSLK